MDFLSKSNSYFTNNTTSYLEYHTAGWIFSLLVVLPENTYVIWLIITGAGNGVAAEFFSLNLSVCEIVFCLQSFLSIVSSAFPDLWYVVGFLSGFCITGFPLFQCLICVEHYLAVLHPVTFLKYKPLRYRVICSIVAWIIILMSCVSSFLAIIHFQMYVFMCWYFSQGLTFPIMFFCCLAVLRALKQSGPGERKRAKENQMKRKAFNIILKIIMAMLFIYAAYLCTGLSYIVTHELIAELWSIGHMCFLLGSLVQPLLYLHRTGKLPFCKAP